MGVQSPPVGSEKSALTKVIWFGLVWTAGIVAGWVIGFYAFWVGFSSTGFYNLPPNATPGQVSTVLRPFFQQMTALIPITLALEIVAFLVLTLGLREFAKIDPHGFSLPSTLMLVLMAGAVIAAAGAIPLVNSVPDVIAKAPYSPGTTPSAAFISAIGSLLIYFAVVALGGVLALIGEIGGLILGVWRLGTRYDEVMLKVAAICVIIPFLNILAPILILIGASSARGRLPGHS